MTTVYASAEAALEGLLFVGMTICAGGLGLCGIPERLIDVIERSGISGLSAADPPHQLLPPDSAPETSSS